MEWTWAMSIMKEETLFVKIVIYILHFELFYNIYIIIQMAEWMPLSFPAFRYNHVKNKNEVQQTFFVTTSVTTERWFVFLQSSDTAMLCAKFRTIWRLSNKL